MDQEVIEPVLIKGFKDGPFIAYGKLIKVKWTGKSIDT